jgi:hypothetical protein
MSSASKPLLPVDFGKSEQCTHDYKRHGTTNSILEKVAMLDRDYRKLVANNLK